ncbi:hypothetical protein HGM15179_014898 [Zosterops borbonicus]|uniref:Uncharacterized protein n=1 Tax=Zosterops borbonicus TaxID=364589 RepID=A0A8K1G5M5_9PASS|nr:hypothetical protein HGM15179_014898 [Zosterops borbonicus]
MGRKELGIMEWDMRRKELEMDGMREQLVNHEEEGVGDGWNGTMMRKELELSGMKEQLVNHREGTSALDPKCPSICAQLSTFLGEIKFTLGECCQSLPKDVICITTVSNGWGPGPQTLKGAPGLAEVGRLPSLGGLVCISMRTECKNSGTGHSGLS